MDEKLTREELLNRIRDLEEISDSYRGMVEASPDLLYRTDASGRISFISPSVFRLSGYTTAEAVGMNMAEEVYLYPRERDAFLKKLSEAGEIYDFEAQLRRKDGSVWWASTNAHLLRDEQGNISGVEGVTRDISERKVGEATRAKLEKQLAESRKMEAVGRLAGGIAHDLNNLLVPIFGYAEMMMMDAGIEDPVRGQLSEILKAARGAEELIRQLLVFSRKQPLDYRGVDLNAVIDGFRNLLRRTIREDVEMVLRLAPELPLVRGDVHRLEQVLMNLAVNGAHAMPSGGRLILETAFEQWSDARAAGESGPPPGEFVVLRVRDSGVGMDEATLGRVFEPFFSTKGEQGTGLGLATVYAVVEQHGGHIFVESRLGEGSTFSVFLPAFAGGATSSDVDGDSEPFLSSGSETVLLVEDNEDVRTVVSHMLSDCGYAVLSAECGPQAIAEMDRRGAPVDLLLTDVIMPGMNGRELFETLSARQPNLKVLYMSGYADDVLFQNGGIDSAVRWIRKPFTQQSLLLAVREVLDA